MVRAHFELLPLVMHALVKNCVSHIGQRMLPEKNVGGLTFREC